MPVAEISLTQGLVAKVSTADLALVAPLKWHAKKAGKTFYAAHGAGSEVVYMHRLIAGIHGGPRGVVVDHLNHDGLDNTRGNLKVCGHAENLRNRRDHKDYLGLPGVTRQGRGYVARIKHENREIYLGFFLDEREAGIAYAAAAKVILTSFGRAT